MTISSSAGTKTAVCLILAFAGCAHLPPAGDVPLPVAAQTRWIDVDDDVVTISIDDDDVVNFSINDEHGVSVEEFIRVGQLLTGKTFTYSRAEVRKAEQRIRLVGRLKVKRGKEFFAFFQTMLYVNGFACVPGRRGNAEIIEIRRRHDGEG